jgi:hypothetical protein
MSQHPRDLFIRSSVKTIYACYIKDEIQGWIARDGYILAYADVLADELPCNATLPQHQGPGRANETSREYLPG